MSSGFDTTTNNVWSIFVRYAVERESAIFEEI